MILTETIKQAEQMDKQEFQTLFFHILQIANTKYNMSFFLSDFKKWEKKTPENKEEFQSNKRIWKSLGQINLNLPDNINIRDYIYDDDFYNNITNKNEQ